MKIRVIVLLLAIAAAACGSGEAGGPPDSEAPSTTATTAGPQPGRPSALPPVACTVDSCHVIAVRLDSPATLDAVRSMATATNADVVALWRSDPVCVADVGSPPGAPPPGRLEPSQFAYVNADVLRDAQDQGPPATDGGWSQAVRDRFVSEWTAALEPGVTFTGAALLAGTPGVEHPSFAEQSPVEWYLTDGAAVLYLRNHWAALEPLLPVTQGEC